MTRVAQEIDSTIWDDCWSVDETFKAIASQVVSEQEHDMPATRPDESRTAPALGPAIPDDVWRLVDGYRPYIG